MKYTKKQAEFLKENEIPSFKSFPFIPRDQQLFMVQYDSVKIMRGGKLIPVLPRIEKEKFIIRQSKMNFKNWNDKFEKEQEEIEVQKFLEHKRTTYNKIL